VHTLSTFDIQPKLTILNDSVISLSIEFLTFSGLIPVETDNTALLSAYLPVSSVKNTRLSYGYASVLCLDYEQISLEI